MMILMSKPDMAYKIIHIEVRVHQNIIAIQYNAEIIFKTKHIVNISRKNPTDFTVEFRFKIKFEYKQLKFDFPQKVP